MKEWLIYWGTWKGEILKAIIIEGARYWNEIRDITNLPPNSLNKALSELYAEGIIRKNYDESYWVIPEIFRKYKRDDLNNCVYARAPKKRGGKLKSVYFCFLKI